MSETEKAYDRITAKGTPGRVHIELQYEDACDLGDILAGLSGPLHRFLPPVFRGFVIRLNTATWEAAPVIREGSDEDQDDDEVGDAGTGHGASEYRSGY